ncbi:MAG TPA: tRNA (adenosine(37)-N6)-threonylcarbamoyltransferase complex transferase subunit TsaD [Clostridia bacterium]|nr:tRNA (adenosine(37)-N6)-threonylcarbamoyltransferase complex transferase subunit TsaD [Clostridia bacterium]HRU84907.1 tRNA (adenosine(37)-N6)-threonylcarbamoyltransferase complex transferase subunit TsaD [Eubacteriales bacterium]
MGYKILGIETSCDETAAAVVEDGRKVLSSVVASQIEIHRRFGGVVPEIASRNHTLSIRAVVEKALAEASCALSDVHAVAVTYGAGLLGALLVGVSFAKGLAYAANKPLYAVNHLDGHIAANYIAEKELCPPYICLLASGGHTAVLKVKSFSEREVLGTTADDSAGEAFDKAARVLGLPYPGGPEIEKAAKSGKANIYFPPPSAGGLNFSFSGIKTAVVNYVANARARNEEINIADIAASFQEAAIGVLSENAVKAAVKVGLKIITVAGGVSANMRLREKISASAEKEGIKVYFPPLNLCTDNAAMIASAAYFMMKSGIEPANLELDACASIPLTRK